MSKTKYITLDLLSSFYLIMPITMSWYISILFIVRYKTFGVILFPLIFTLTLSASIFLLRLPLTTLKRDIFPIGFNKKYISWYLNLFLLRAVLGCGIRSFLNAMSWSRFLIFKALGARISYFTNIALTAEVIDLPLITIGTGSLVGDHAKLSCHIFNKNKIILRPITIGKNCIILSSTSVPPGSHLKDDQVMKKDKSI